jgi:hypothetical protein
MPLLKPLTGLRAAQGRAARRDLSARLSLEQFAMEFDGVG